MNTLLALLLLPLAAQANPYPIEARVPKDPRQLAIQTRAVRLDARELKRRAIDTIRVRVDWDQARDAFKLGAVVRERSGTPALVARAANPDKLGSYQGVLRDRMTGEALAHDSIGTGALFRKLTRSISFRFPVPARAVRFEMTGENPVTGRMEPMLAIDIEPRAVPAERSQQLPEVRVIRPARTQPSLRLVIYSEGYLEGRQEAFWQDAEKTAKALETSRFPGVARLEILAAFMPSAMKLGAAQDLGLPVPERDTALGLYFPYWEKFGRWFHVVYPTREERFRAALATVPYDYPLALVDDGQYWGVGNYREHTAIPAQSSSFTYLLLHEIGHFFGLNEEYNGGGRTELEFARGIEEPWSQNITFLRNPAHANLKWNAHVQASTPLPTPQGIWTTSRAYGAYLGGYADSEPTRTAHKPGLSCVMEAGGPFCPVCSSAIEAVMAHDVGLGGDALSRAFSSAP